MINESKKFSGDELRQHWEAIERSLRAMSVEAGSLLEAMCPGYLPDQVLADIEAKTRRFSAAIRTMGSDCLAFQRYAERLLDEQAVREKESILDHFSSSPAGKSIN